MKNPQYNNNWPQSWKESYKYDQLELYNREYNSYIYQFRNRFNNLIRMIKQWLPIGTSILDIAAAQGNFTLTLAEAGYNVTWNDLREDLIGYVKLKYEYGKVDYCPGNILEKGGQEFDAVIISEIIEHVAYPDKFLKIVAALVKPGGFIFLSTPLGSYSLNRLPKFSNFPNPTIFEKEQFKPNADGHIFILYKDELEKFALESNLLVRETVIQNNYLTEGHYKLRLLYKFLPVTFIRKIEKLTQKLPLFIRLKMHNNISMVLQKV